MTTAASLAAFFKTFEHTRRRAAQRDLPARLAELFARLRLARAYAADAVAEVRSRRAQRGPDIDEARLRALFAQLAGPIERARRGGQLTDVWSMAGLGRNEVRTAAALAALWNPRLCGAIAVDFLAAFFARLGSHDLPDHPALAAGYTIRTEDRPLGRADERVDIVVETRSFLIGIEIKIDAPERDGQLEDYRAALSKRLSFKQMPGKGPPQRLTAALVYLALNPDTRSDLASIGARWNDVAAAARSVVPRRAAERGFVHHFSCSLPHTSPPSERIPHA